MVRLIDANALSKTVCKERDRIFDTYGANDEYVLCLNKYALSMIENAPTIDAIPVEWLQKQVEEYPKTIWGGWCMYVLQGWRKEQEEHNATDRP